MTTRCVVRGARLVPLQGERAVTLVELIVVLAILGLILGISGLALASLRQPRESDVGQEMRRARTEAIRTGTMVRIATHRAPRTAYLFLPDGRAIGPGLDPLTGAPHDSTR